MGLTYYKFLFINTIKKKSIWITWLLYLVTTVAFIIILPLASTLSVYQLWANTTIAICETFIGVCAAIFTAILAINIFKDTNEEGTELIIISKPVTRISLVLSKFVIFFLFCLLVNLSAVLITLFTIFMPNIERKFYWGLVVSMLIGNLVTFGVFGAISILLTIRFAKVGIIVTNVIVSMVLLAYQILAVFVFNSSLLVLAGKSTESVIPNSYILPVRNTKDGTYTEEHFVDFVSGLNKNNQYDMKVTDWYGVKDYWAEQNSKENAAAIIATDIGTQFSLSYLTVGVNGYSDRQAQRMYNFSRYYKYDLTNPVSPEYYEIYKDKESPFKMVYTGFTSWQSIKYEGKTYNIYLPVYYSFPGVRNTKASYLKGTVTDIIPIADLKGKQALAHTDVVFEPEQWKKYKEAFDIMYDTVFSFNATKGNGSHYYDFDYENAYKTFTLNNVWCNSTDNLNRYYRLVWACLTGNSGKDEYLGSNSPMKQYTQDWFDIHSVQDLNTRFLQFKDYVFYKAYDDQHELMFNGVKNLHSDAWDLEKPFYTSVKTIINGLLAEQDCGLTQYTDTGFVIRADDTLHNAVILQPNTQTFNNTLLSYTKDAQIAAYKQIPGLPEATWVKSASEGSYGTWLKTVSVVNYCSQVDEKYLFDSLEKPIRNDNWTSEQYLTRKSWYPYYLNYQAQATGYLPYGQNLELSFYSCNNRVQFWWFAVIWGCMALMAYAAGFIVYNKYDVK